MLSKKSDEVGAVIVANTQTAGKGRMGREWVSPKGGIWMSVVLQPRFDVAKITLIPLVAAVALSNAISRLLKIKTELKWPNDVTINGRKVAGIVIDAAIESSRLESLVLGVGINFKINPSEIEKRIKVKDNFYGVSTLVKKGDKTRPSELIQAFLEELEKTLDVLNCDGPIPIISQWIKKSSTIGRIVSIRSQTEKVSGKALRLDIDGGLMVRCGSKLIKIMSGDVGY
jgi:BirA family biotin operon repressor/biotin-[acetyl-CoA-carboxylase] ligase